MRFLARVLLALGVTSTALAVSAPARADASAWVFVGGGALGWKVLPQTQPATDTTQPTAPATSRFGVNGTLAFDVGVGTSPDAPVIVGGVFRLQPILAHGTDMMLFARVATRGFQAGDIGFALDAGGYLRFWETKSQGFAGNLTLGLPLGFQLSLQATAGTNSALGFGAVAGIDFLRLTVYRKTLLDRWQNPSPTWNRVGMALGLVGRRD